MMKSTKSISAALLLSALLGASLMACQKAEGPAEKAGKQIDQTLGLPTDKPETATEKVGEQIEMAGEKIQDAAKKD